MSAKEVNTTNRLSNHLALLLPGTMVSLDIVTPAGQRGKFRTFFIGYLPKKYVLVQFPDSNKLGNFTSFISQGTSITVRGLIEGHEGSVVAFASTVKQTLQMPSRMIVLEFPKKVTLQSLRSSLRIDVNIPVKVKIDNEYWKGIISNISVNGCQITINNGESLTLTSNKKIQIIVEDFLGLQNINLSADVCNVKSQVEGVSLGVKFVNESKENVTKLVQHAVVAEI
ncbi:PilZ domain-containing protein [Pseudocolwellia agarivorans]|uniref:PilZ domain-containing protein n=1 Tax=Pseudocolwellia agarivorans TaxID=1911682 RepID=UPI003F8833CD